MCEPWVLIALTSASSWSCSSRGTTGMSHDSTASMPASGMQHRNWATNSACSTELDFSLSGYPILAQTVTLDPSVLQKVSSRLLLSRWCKASGDHTIDGEANEKGFNGAYLFCEGEVLQQQWEELILLLGKMLSQRDVDLLHLTHQLPATEFRCTSGQDASHLRVLLYRTCIGYCFCTQDG